MIINYDSDNYAVLINKKKLESVGIREGDNFYIINLDRGVIALVKKSDFKNVLKQKVRDALGSDYNTMKDFGLSNEQIKVIDKIIGVKFEERTQPNISSSLSNEENAILEDLIKSNTIKIYDQGKYIEKPVYSITPDLFKYVKSTVGTPSQSSQNYTKKERDNTSTNTYTEKKYSPPPQLKSPVDIGNLIDKFNKEGFMIVTNDNEAKMVSESLSQKIKAGEVIGIKGFDSRYYIFKSSFFNKSNDKIVESFSKFNGKCSLKDMCNSTGLDENVCKGILWFLLERGDVIEKSNSTYQMI